VSSKLQELEEDAEKERQRNSARNGGNAGAAGGVPQSAEGDGHGAAEPQQTGGASNVMLMLMLLHQS
jgi:hypothetical protein